MGGIHLSSLIIFLESYHIKKHIDIWNVKIICLGMTYIVSFEPFPERGGVGKEGGREKGGGGMEGGGEEWWRDEGELGSCATCCFRYCY